MDARIAYRTTRNRAFRIRISAAHFAWPVRGSIIQARGRGSSVRASNPSHGDSGRSRELHCSRGFPRSSARCHRGEAPRAPLRARARARATVSRAAGRVRGSRSTGALARPAAQPRLRRAVDELRKGLSTALYQEVMAKTAARPTPRGSRGREGRVPAARAARGRDEHVPHEPDQGLDPPRLQRARRLPRRVRRPRRRCAATSARDYCSIAQHNAEMCLRVIAVAIDLGNFVYVNNYVVKAEHAPSADALTPAARGRRARPAREQAVPRGRAQFPRSRPSARRRARAARRRADRPGGAARARPAAAAAAAATHPRRTRRSSARGRRGVRHAVRARELRARELRRLVVESASFNASSTSRRGGASSSPTTTPALRGGARDADALQPGRARPAPARDVGALTRAIRDGASCSTACRTSRSS